MSLVFQNWQQPVQAEKSSSKVVGSDLRVSIFPVFIMHWGAYAMNLQAQGFAPLQQSLSSFLQGKKKELKTDDLAAQKMKDLEGDRAASGNI